MIRKLNYFGELYIDDDGHVMVKTKNGNMFVLDDVTDLTTIEAKDVLIGKVEPDDDDEDCDITNTVKRKVYAKKMVNKWKDLYKDENDNITKQMKWSKP